MYHAKTKDDNVFVPFSVDDFLTVVASTETTVEKWVIDDYIARNKSRYDDRTILVCNSLPGFIQQCMPSDMQVSNPQSLEYTTDYRSNYSTYCPIEIVVQTALHTKEENIDDGVSSVEDCTTEVEDDTTAEEIPYTVKRIVRPMSELAQVLAEMGKKKYRIDVRLPDGKLLCADSYEITFYQFVKAMGWERVRRLNFDIYGKLLFSTTKINSRYKEIAPGWYLNLNMKANDAKILVYQIAKALGEKVTCNHVRD